MVPQRSFKEEIPAFDEGWWASILADEENMMLATATRQQKVEERIKSPLDWEQAQELYAQDQIVSLTVTGFNRGGLLVEGNGLCGFVPCSHLLDKSSQVDDDERGRLLAAYVRRTLSLKVIECAPEEGRIVFSERAAKAGEGCRTQLLNSLHPGQHVRGEVTNITDFGVFVDLGGVEGLIHISELSWGRVGHPAQILHLGETVEVLVLEVALERCRIALSLKRLSPNPWESAAGHYSIDQIVPAQVTALTPFGAFARLEEGLEGLIHISEIPMAENARINDVLTPGQQVQVRILQIDVNRQRLGLSLRLNENS